MASWIIMIIILGHSFLWAIVWFFGKKLLWYRFLFDCMDVGCPWCCAVVWMKLFGRLMSLSYNSTRAGWVSSLLRILINSENLCSFLLCCSGSRPSFSTASLTPLVPLIPAMNLTAWFWTCSKLTISLLLLVSLAAYYLLWLLLICNYYITIKFIMVVWDYWLSLYICYYYNYYYCCSYYYYHC